MTLKRSKIIPLLLSLGILALVLAPGRPVRADGVWEDNGRVVCDNSGAQWRPSILYAGNNTIYMAWTDNRNAGTYQDLYAQKFDADGNSLWAENGILVCNAPWVQGSPRLVSDGNSGVVIAWTDDRDAVNYYDIYCQRLDPNGTLLWTGGTNGRVICDLPNTHSAGSLNLVPDGQGGAILAWRDNRNSATTGLDIFAQRVGANGNTLWAENGLVVCNANADQMYIKMVTAGGQGALLAWQDPRSGTTDIYAQRLDNSGSVPAPWPANGLGVCTYSGGQYQPKLAADGAGGAIILWSDMRDTEADLYAQRIAADASVQWAANGVVVCNDGTLQSRHDLTADGAGGAVAVWVDARNSGTTNDDIYAQRLSSTDGSSLWTSNGLLVCNNTNNQDFPLVTAGGGAFYLCWRDEELGNIDMYSQKISAGGSLLWRAGGVYLCNDPSPQYDHQLVSDGADAAFVIWDDDRTGSTDLYIQKILRPRPHLESMANSTSPLGILANVQVSGTGFSVSPGSVDYVKLTRTGQPDIVGTSLQLLSDTSMTCVFDLTSTSTALGDWTLMAFDSLGQTATANTMIFTIYPPSAQSLTWISALEGFFYGPSQDNLVGQLNLEVAGYDTLSSLMVENIGTAESPGDITGLSLWYHATGGSGGLSFDPAQATRLGGFTPTAARAWFIALTQTVQDQAALYITADAGNNAVIGSTCRFSLPASGAQFQLAGALPGQAYLNTYAQTITRGTAVQLDLVSETSTNLVKGQTGANLASITLSNVSGIAITLDSLRLGLTNGDGQPHRLDSVFSRVWLESAGQLVAEQSGSLPADTVLDFSPSQVLPNQAIPTYQLRADILSAPALARFRIGLLDAQVVNTGNLLATPVQGQVFPLLTDPTNLRDRDIRATFSNYPNPFNPDRTRTRIPYFLKSQARVELKIFNFQGDLVADLVNEEQSPGLYESLWNGKNQNGHRVVSGVYYLRIRLNYQDGSQDVLTRKLAVVR